MRWCKTIFEAILLVVCVVIIFLQTWRASLIPVIAIPVSLIGTFAILAAVGISLNNLSLFGLVLAVGIVVDDAIVVVENVERNLRLGMTPKEAAHRTMDEVGGALIAIALDALRGLRALGLPLRHFRAVLPPVRRHDLGLDRHFLLRLADPEPGALRRAVQGRIRSITGGRRSPAAGRGAGFGRFNAGLRVAVGRLWPRSPAGLCALLGLDAHRSMSVLSP